MFNYEIICSKTKKDPATYFPFHVDSTTSSAIKSLHGNGKHKARISANSNNENELSGGNTEQQT